jgi:hypothetical protein
MLLKVRKNLDTTFDYPSHNSFEYDRKEWHTRAHPSGVLKRSIDFMCNRGDMIDPAKQAQDSMRETIRRNQAAAAHQQNQENLRKLRKQAQGAGPTGRAIQKLLFVLLVLFIVGFILIHMHK